MSKARAEFIAPASDCLVPQGDFLRGVSYYHAALEEPFLDVSQAQLKAKIPADSATDDHSRKAVAAIKRFRFFHHAILRDWLNNLTMPSKVLFATRSRTCLTSRP